MLDNGEVQGNVLHAYGRDYGCARHVLLRVRPGGAREARETLGRWLPDIAFGRTPEGAPRPPRTRMNIAFTWEGLRALDVPPDLLHAFPEAFRQGARERAKGNGDTGASDPDGWDPRLGRGHILVTVHGRSPDAVGDHVTALVARAQGMGDDPHHRAVALLEHDREDPEGTTCGSDYDREHFGFSDGCSQPAIEGVHDDPVGGGVHGRVPPSWPGPLRSLQILAEDVGLKRVRRAWRPLKAGEFLLGHEDEQGELPEGPPAPLGPNGTFMVYRELDQHVASFRAYVSGHAADLGRAKGWSRVDAAFVGAKIMGRWADGTPLATCPGGEDEDVARNRRRANDFLYRHDGHGYVADEHGYRCPLGAHIRRTNPRDALPGGAERTARHRIIRRGMPYGPRLPEHPSQAELTAERGLAFVCFQASIVNGFEFIQRQWASRGEALGLGDERDLLLTHDGAALTTTTIPVPGGQSVVLRPPPAPLVTVRGCEYLFVPSRSACAWLSRLH